MRARSSFRGSFSGYERHVFFTNVGRGKPYVEAGHAYGLDFEDDGRAVAAVDVDGDGDLDLAVLSLQGLRLLQNQSASPVAKDSNKRLIDFVRVRLRTATGGVGVGAEVTVESEGLGKQVDLVDLTAGFHTQQSAERHFGLGAAKTATVAVRWASGRVDRWPDLAPGAYTLVEGGAVEPRQIPRWPADAMPRTTRAFDLGVRAEPLLTDGLSKRLGAGGKPTVVNFWAPWCEACKRELPALAAYARSVGDRVAVVGVSVAADDLSGSRAMAGRMRLGFDLRRANDRVVQSFFGAGGRIPLPATFVFDDRGRLQRSYYREIDAAEIAALVAEFHPPPTLEDFRKLALGHIGAGKHREAGAVLGEAALALTDPDSKARIGTLYLHVGRNAMGRHLLEQAVRQRPNDVDALASLGWALREEGELDAAERVLRGALRKAPAHAHANNHLGRVMEARGERRAAAALYRAALASDPDFGAARRNLQRVEK